MANEPSDENDKAAPAPEALKPKSDKPADTPESTESSSVTPKPSLRPRHVTYRPSHKATFIGLAIVAVILAVNAVVIGFFIKSRTVTTTKTNQSEVVLSPGVLDNLGVSRTPVGNLGMELVVGPNSKFNGTLQVAKDVSIAGELKLNSKFSAASASLAQLEAGNTSLQQLNVNGDGTVSNLSLRRDLQVAGTTRFQGPVTVSQLLTVNNSLNVSGNLSVGGVLAANGFQARSLISDTTLVIGGHIITQGLVPGFAQGPSLGTGGTSSMSGNDASGTIAVNIGVGGAPGGTVGTVTFRNRYSSTPHVVVTAVGRAVDSFYVNRSSTGFSLVVSGPMSAGTYVFDYIVMQ